jgi:predicted nucleotide-binding protein
MENLIESFEKLLKEAKDLKYEYLKNGTLFDKIELKLKRKFGNESAYLTILNEIKYNSTSKAELQFIIDFESIKNRLINLLLSIIEDLNDNKDSNLNVSVNSPVSDLSKKIFIVHGHNEEMKQSVVNTIMKLNLKPIVLHEQPNKGKTLIEKFIENADVDFVIVLLSGDDKAVKKEEDLTNFKLRCRQNVIFELGYFIAKLGRERVFALYEENDLFELPSDYNGIVYNPYNKNNSWRLDLVKELKSIGYDVDANHLLKN